MIATNAKHKLKSWQGAATVQELIDGDTFKADIDLGFKIRITTNVRVFGCNAPELPTPAGLKALAFIKTVLRPGEIVTLSSKRLDKFGRAEATVTLADGRDLTNLMLTSGNAIPADSTGNLPQKNEQPGTLPGLPTSPTPQNTAWK
jgi:endonuclease YncB( thermonuclease family)